MTYSSLIFIFISACLCSWLAERKHRNIALWGFLGLFFNVIALLIILCLPSLYFKLDLSAGTLTDSEFLKMHKRAAR